MSAAIGRHWLVIAMGCILLGGNATRAAVSAPPNVLMIVIDDLNDWVSPLHGHPLANTPQFDRLARRGTTFSNAHAQAPLCNPSRTSVMLGLRPGTTGIYGLRPWFRTVPQLAERVTLPQAFRFAGYYTAVTGKVYHGVASAAASPMEEFEVWGPAPGVGVRPAHKLIPPTPMGNHPLMDWGAFPHEESSQGDYQITSWTLDQLATVPRDRPFFIATGFTLPHVPIYVTPERLARVPDTAAVLPLILANDRADTPRFSWYLHWQLPEPRTHWLRAHDQLQPLSRAYLAAISFIDDQIGRLLDGLDALGLAENTLVVLWSDHGYHLGEKAISGKNSLWERSTHVPLLIAGPGVTTNQICGEPVELLDLFPTLAELAGLSAPSDLEGHSLVPQLHDARIERVWPAITTANAGNNAVRDRTWRYIRYADGSEELYNLANDPAEWNNLAADPTLAATLRRLRAFAPVADVPPAPGSAARVLIYNPADDTAQWENTRINRQDPIPE